NLMGTYMIKPVVNAVGAGDADALVRGVALTAVIYVVGVASAAGYTQTMVCAAQKVVFDIRRDLFAHIERLPLSFFDRTRHGDVMSYFTNDVDTVSEALNNSFANLVQAAVQIVGTLTLLFVLDWRLTLITVACDLAIA
ncbi:ABC transporter transmembrane domain-containing protein, partial [Bacteroides mediterraneensis]